MPWPTNRAIDDDTWEEWYRRFGETDRIAGFEIARAFESFSHMNDVFTRAFGDTAVKSKDTEAFFASYRVAPVSRASEGFSLRDFALRDTSWIVSDLLSNRGRAEGLRQGFQTYLRAENSVAAENVALGPLEVEAASPKHIARLLSADLVGITEIDERWHYTRGPDTRSMTPVPSDLPAGLIHVILMAHAMDFDLVAA